MIQALSVGEGDLGTLRRAGWMIAPHAGSGLVTVAVWAPERAGVFDLLAGAIADEAVYAVLADCGNLTAGGLVLVRGGVIRPGVVSGVSFGDSPEAEAVRQLLVVPVATREGAWRTALIHALHALADALRPGCPPSLADALFA